MPNIDTGCYFFTAFVPLRNDGLVEHQGVRCSPLDAVRDYLAHMPAALQSPAAEKGGINSPFARNPRVHFARLVVLEQPYFNGRDPSNAIIDQLRNVDLLKPQAAQQLPCPYILFLIDYDLVDPEAAGEPSGFLEQLWSLMDTDLQAIFGFCYGFETVQDASSFASWMMRCQIETTMPFHDYWWQPVKLASLPFMPLLGALGGSVLLPILAGVFHWVAWPWALAGLVILPLLAVCAVYQIIMVAGRRRWPTPADASLHHVLKGLYLQQAFTDFAIDQQLRAPAERGAAFRRFLEQSRPADLDGPTQMPGVVKSSHSDGQS